MEAWEQGGASISIQPMKKLSMPPNSLLKHAHKYKSSRYSIFNKLFVMKKIFLTALLIFPGLAPQLSIAQSITEKKDLAKLGVSQVNITPDQPVILSGYDARKTPSTGVHDSLFASALFFSGEQKALLI